MALDKVTFHLPFSNGQEQRAGELFLAPPGLAVLENMHFDRTGELRKRFGTNVLTDTASGGGPNSLQAGETQGLGVRADSELLQVHERTLYTWTDTVGLSGGLWYPRGPCWNVEARQRQIASEFGASAAYPYNVDHDQVHAYARWGDYEVYFMFLQGIVLRDVNTKAFIEKRAVSTTVSFTGARIRVDRTNNAFYVIWNANSNDFNVLRIRLSSAANDLRTGTIATRTVTTAGSLGDPLSWDAEWDASANELVAVSFFNSTNYVLTVWNQDLSTVNTYVGATGSGAHVADKYALVITKGVIFVFYYATNGSSNTIHYNRYSFGSRTTFTIFDTGEPYDPTVMAAGADNALTRTDTTIYVYVQSEDDFDGTPPGGIPADNPVQSVYLLTLTALDDPTPTLARKEYLRRTHLVSRPAFYDNTSTGERIPIIAVVPDVRSPKAGNIADTGRISRTGGGYGDNTYLALYDGRYGYANSLDEPMQPLARMLPGEIFERNFFARDDTYTGGQRERKLMDLNPYTLDGTAFDFAYTSDTGPVLLSFDMEARRANESLALGRSTYFPGGYLKVYDGEAVKEAAPFLYPDNISWADTTTGGAQLSINTTYQYAFYWCFRNAQNEICRSTAIPVTAATSGATQNSIRFWIPICPHTRLAAETREFWLEVYRTDGDPTGVDDPRYLVNRSPAYSLDDVGLGLGAYVYNDLSTQNYVEYLDTTGDSATIGAAWGTSPPDPTNAGALDQIPALAPVSLHAGQNRIFYVGPDLGGNEIYYSKLRSDGEIASFNEGLVGLIPQVGGEITGVHPSEGKVYVFRERMVCVLAGVGPDNIGRGSYGLAEIIDPVTGLHDPRAMAPIPGGLMFYADRGWHFLSRADQIQYIGSGVDQFSYDENNQPAGCVVIPEKHHVICFSDSPNEETVVFDWLVQQWSNYTEEYRARAARWFRGKVYWVESATGGRIEFPATNWVDEPSETNVISVVETAWIKVDQGQGRFGDGGINGWGRNYWWELVGEIGQAVGEPPLQPDQNLKVQVAYNYETGFTDEFDYTFFAGPFRIRERFRGAYQKSAAVKFRIEHQYNNIGENAPLVLQGLSLQVGLKQGVTRAQPQTRNG